MVQSEFSGASPNAHLLIGQMPAPNQLHGPGWEGTGLSIVAHAILVGVLAYAAAHVPQVALTASDVPRPFKIVALDGPGARGEGRVGGEDVVAPPREAQVVRTKAVEISATVQPIDAPQDVIVPVATVQATQMLPGAAVQLDTRSPGRGSGPGVGTGDRPGSGFGDGPGSRSGFGDDVHGMGNGVKPPVLIKEVKPNYTGQAMRAKLQGPVEMEAVVLPDGSVDSKSIRITRSLDSIFGLDEQAIIAVKQWRFRPGTLRGQPVAVLVTVELTFTLR